MQYFLTHFEKMLDKSRKDTLMFGDFKIDTKTTINFQNFPTILQLDIK